MRFAVLPGIDESYPNMSEPVLDALLASIAGVKNVGNVKQLYSPSKYTYPKDLGNYSQSWWTAIRARTDRVPGLGACGVRNFSQSFHAGGSPAVFSYLFAHPPQIAFQPSSGPGSVLVGHGAEVPYVFGEEYWGLIAHGEEADLSMTMVQYWSNFASRGDPNGAGLPSWPKYGDEGDVILRLQTLTDGGIKSQNSLRKDACDFWDAHPRTSHPKNSEKLSRAELSPSVLV